jgi:hypothetical protein
MRVTIGDHEASDGTGGGRYGLSGRTCRLWIRALSDAVGCQSPVECDVEAACRSAANALLDCISQDSTQCLCEKDDDELNCKGASKPSQGPSAPGQAARPAARCGIA